MTRKNLSTRCCHCASRVRVLYRLRRAVEQSGRFRLRFDCPVCHTPLLYEAGEVWYDESAMSAAGNQRRSKAVARHEKGHIGRPAPARLRSGGIRQRFGATPHLSLVE